MSFKSKWVETDCLVIGGGPAGFGAALAAQRGGCSVILAERHGFLGGMGTAAGLSCYLNHHNHNVDLSGSLYREFVRLQDECGMHYWDAQSQADFFEPECCKCTMEMLLLNSGARLIFHVLLTEVKRIGEFWHATLAHKGGRTYIRCRYLVDTSGDGDTCALAGAMMTHGRRSDGKTQPMSMVVQLGGFNPQIWQDAGHRLVDGKYATEGDWFKEEVKSARQAGQWSIPRNEIALFWAMPSDPTRVTINGTRINGFSACDAMEMTQAEIEGRRQAVELLAFFRNYVPGFANAYLLQTGPQVGVRESRRIVGRATLGESEVRSGALPDSTVVLCSYPIDVHSPEGNDTQFEAVSEGYVYGIPWECMLPKGLSNIIAAGRCISATHEAAGSFRVMPTCMTLGEAAGTAVAIAKSKDCDLDQLSGKYIRERMQHALQSVGDSSSRAELSKTEERPQLADLC